MKKTKVYTFAQITSVVSFVVAFFSAIGQIIAIFIPDQNIARWVNAVAMLVAIIGVIVGLVAFRQSTREQIEQFEAEREAREGAIKKTLTEIKDTRLFFQVLNMMSFLVYMILEYAVFPKEARLIERLRNKSGRGKHNQG